MALFFRQIAAFILPCSFCLSSFADIITNGGFEQLDADGKPIDWYCSCPWESQRRCQITQAQSHSGKNSLVIPPACIVFTKFAANPAQNGFRFELYAQGTALKTHDFSISGYGLGHKETSYARSFDLNDQWIQVKSQPISSLDSTGAGSITIRNSNTTDLIIDDIVVFQDVPNPVKKVGSIIKVRHRSLITVSENSDEVWFPLPLDYAAQTPLSVAVQVIPVEAMKAIRYDQDIYGNWGAYVKFDNSYVGDVRLNWDALVLVRDVPDSEQSEAYASTQDPNIWTQASPLSDSSFFGIRSTADQITQNISSSKDKLKNILAWMTQNIVYQPNINQDATHVFQRHAAVCTGFANLGSAMGRATNIPTRTVANILVGVAQQTHYINEFYLSSATGWFRVEPQNGYPIRTNNDYGIIVHIVRPEDEGIEALNGSEWAGAGVPSWSLVRGVGQAKGLLPHEISNSFLGCPSCDNEAMHLVDIRTNFNQFKKSFLSARAVWQRDLISYLDGTISPSQIELRKTAEHIKNETDLDLFLSQIH